MKYTNKSKSTNAIFKKTSSFINRESLSDFLNDIRKYPLLSREEEYEAALAKDINKLVCHNLRYAVSVAHSFDHMGNMADLLQCACVGMIKAANNYEPSDDQAYFIAYAKCYMKYEILEYCRRTTTNYSRADFIMCDHIARYRESYQAEFGHEPSVGEIAESLGVEELKVADLLTRNRQTVSLDSPIDNEEDDLNVGSTIAGDLNSDDELCQADRKTVVNDALNRYLTGKEACVVRMFFGIGTEAKSIDDIAFELDFTRQRINQLKKSALTKLFSVGELKEML